MGSCVHCGRPAGMLQRRHRECEARHKHAITLISTLFPQFIKGRAPADRFSELLRVAAEASFVTPDELRSLIASGIDQIIGNISQERVSLTEVQRLAELVRTLPPDDSARVSFNERLAQLNIISELQDGRVPNSISK